MKKLIVRQLPPSDYDPIWQQMKAFTHARDEHTTDEIWLLEHPPVFTQGLAGKAEHVLNPKNIPVVQTDRGGQVTYHGPGQLMVYTLIDLHRLNLGTRDFVIKLEQTVIDLLADFGIEAAGKRDAPGVYVEGAKICSIGLRVRRGRAYHGIALNVDMDLSPFKLINPCGFAGLKMTDIKALNKTATLAGISKQIIPALMKNFGYTAQVSTTGIAQNVNEQTTV